MAKQIDGNLRSTPQALRISDEAGTSRVSLNRSPSRTATVVSPAASPAKSTHTEVSPKITGTREIFLTPPTTASNNHDGVEGDFSMEKIVISSSPQSSRTGQNQSPSRLVAALNAARRASLLHEKSSFTADSSESTSLTSSRNSFSLASPVEGEDSVMLAAAQHAMKRQPTLINHSRMYLPTRRAGKSDSQVNLDRSPRSGNTPSESVAERSRSAAPRQRQFSIDKGLDDIPLKAAKILGEDLEKIKRQQGGLPASIARNKAGESLDPPRQRSIEEDQDALSPIIKRFYGNNPDRMSPLPIPTPSPRLDDNFANTAGIRDGLHPRFNSIVTTNSLSSPPSTGFQSAGSPRTFMPKPQHPSSARLPPTAGLGLELNGDPLLGLGLREQSIDGIPQHSMETMVDSTQPAGNNLLHNHNASLLMALRSHPPDHGSIPRRSKTLPPQRARKTSFANEDLLVDTSRASKWRGSVISTPYPHDSVGRSKTIFPKRIGSKRDGGLWERFGRTSNNKPAETDLQSKPATLTEKPGEETTIPSSPAEASTTDHSPTDLSGTERRSTHPNMPAHPGTPTPRPQPPPTPNPLPPHPDPFLTILIRHPTTRTIRSTQVHIPMPTKPRAAPSTVPPQTDDEDLARSILSAYHRLRGPLRHRLSARTLAYVKVLSPPPPAPSTAARSQPPNFTLPRRRGSNDTATSSSSLRRRSIDEYMGLSASYPSYSNTTYFNSQLPNQQTPWDPTTSPSTDLTTLLHSPHTSRDKTALLTWSRAGSNQTIPPISPIKESHSPVSNRDMSLREALDDEAAPALASRVLELREGWAWRRILVVVGVVLGLSIAAGLLWVFLGAGGGTVVSLGAVEGANPQGWYGGRAGGDNGHRAAGEGNRTGTGTGLMLGSGSGVGDGALLGGTGVSVRLGKGAPGGRVAGGVALAAWVLMAGMMVVGGWMGGSLAVG
ncbi:MAG: hypothetical protein MMC23_004793 [Stictis urceolatum]|nr:hypothetical protein [Stictis urceolata]